MKSNKGNSIPVVAILSLVIVGSLVYFGNFWYKVATDSTSKEKEETENVLSENEPRNSAPQPKAVSEENKNEKPYVELFVMSHCPFGTQIEKGIIPVVKALGSNIDFDLKFVDYIMHGKEEIDEQLAQYCIQENNPDSLIAYLECFLEDSDSPGCLTEVGINQANLADCIQNTDQTYAITDSYEDKSTWASGRYPMFDVHKEENELYGVQGSPTLVVNGVQANASGRDAQSLLTTICDYFENKPEECNLALSAEAPAPGFGYDSAGSSAPSTAVCD